MRSNGPGGSPSSVVDYGTIKVCPDPMPVERLANLQVEQDGNGDYVTGLTVGGVSVRVRLDPVVQTVKGPLRQHLADLARLQEMQQSGEHGEWLATGIAEKATALTTISQSLVDSVAAADPALSVYLANGQGFDIRFGRSNCKRPPSLRFFAGSVDVSPSMVGFPLYLPQQRGNDAIRYAWDQSANRLLLIAVCGQLQGGEQAGSLSLFLKGGGQVAQVEAMADHELGLRINSCVIGAAVSPPNVVSSQANTVAA